MVEVEQLFCAGRKDRCDNSLARGSRGKSILASRICHQFHLPLLINMTIRICGVSNSVCCLIDLASFKTVDRFRHSAKKLAEKQMHWASRNQLHSSRLTSHRT